jgi:hypothetical protein
MEHRCRPWARAQPATSARPVACAARTSGYELPPRSPIACGSLPPEGAAVFLGAARRQNSMTPQAAFEHNGALVERSRFYAIACDPRRSVAVEACAGAGKTWMLVSRIVRALLEGSAPARDSGHHLHQEGGWRDAPASAGMAGAVCPPDRCAVAPGTAATRPDAGAHARPTAAPAPPAPDPAAGRPPGADSHLPQLVCRAGAQCALAGAGRYGPAHPLRAAGKRCPGRGPGLAAFSGHGGRRPERARRLPGGRGGPWAQPDAKGAGVGAVQAGGVCAGRCARRGRRLGADLWRTVPGLCRRGCARGLAGHPRRARPAAGCRTPAGRVHVEDLPGGSQRAGAGRHCRRPGWRAGRAADAKGHAAQVERQAGRHRDRAPGTGLPDGNGPGPAPAPGLAAPAAHGAPDRCWSWNTPSSSANAAGSTWATWSAPRWR